MQLHGDTLKYRFTDGRLCFVRALSVPCIALGQKVVRQQFLVEMTHVAFEDLFRSTVQSSQWTEKALVDQNADLRLRL